MLQTDNVKVQKNGADVDTKTIHLQHERSPVL